jgi:methylmalonyl-CoA carboxyltransferase 12S subunit
MRASLKTGSPFVFINDSGGARVQEGIDSLAGYGRSSTQRDAERRGAAGLHHLRSLRGRRGVFPGADRLHHPDARAQMFITGPQVIKQVTGETVTPTTWADPRRPHDVLRAWCISSPRTTGGDGICKKLLSFLPSNNLEDPPVRRYRRAVDRRPRA